MCFLINIVTVGGAVEILGKLYAIEFGADKLSARTRFPDCLGAGERSGHWLNLADKPEHCVLPYKYCDCGGCCRNIR